MLGRSLRKALLACAASAVLADSLMHRCSAATAGETGHPPPTQHGSQGPSFVATATEKPQEYVPGQPGFLEGKNPASQVAALNSGRLESLAFPGSSGEQGEAAQSQLTSHPEASFQLQISGAPHLTQTLEATQNRTRAVARRRLEGLLAKLMDSHELSSKHTSSRGISPRRLQLLAGISQLAQLPQLNALPNLLGSSLSARDRDQLEAFSRRVATSRERVYKDLLFSTGGRQHGLDEFSMKQLVAKVGLENLSAGNVPSSAQLSQQEFRVLDAARRSHFSVERIIATYEREVAQHAKTLRNALEANMNNPSIRAKIASIVSDNLFRRPRDINVRRLQDFSHNRKLASLLQGQGLLGTAGSLIRSMDPANLSQTLSAGLGGFGLQHLHLPNIGGLALRQDGTSQALLPITDIGGLQQALQSVFPLSQQVVALSGPLRSFQQGVETATDGAIGAFLSREGLLPFLSIDTAKELLGSLIGGEAIGPSGLKGWDDLGLPPVSASGLARVMPFETFLNKFAVLAHEVDSDVGIMKREARKRLGAGGFPIVPDQLSQIDGILDRLVWGILHAPARRLQQTRAEEIRGDRQPQTQLPVQHMPSGPRPSPETATAEAQHTIAPVQPTPHPPVVPRHPPQQTPPNGLTLEPELSLPLQQPLPEPQQPTADSGQSPHEPQKPTVESQQPVLEPEPPSPVVEQPTTESQQPAPEPEGQAPMEQGPEESQQQQDQQEEDSSASIDNLLGALLDSSLEGGDSEEEMHAALQRVELLADAVTVLLKEYEKAVEHLQDLLDDQLDAAEEIREELEDQVEEFKDQVKATMKPKKQGAADAAAEVARAYDEAMEGFKSSLEALLEQPQTNQPASPAVQEDLAALAARIQAAAEEKLPSLVTAL